MAENQTVEKDKPFFLEQLQRCYEGSLHDDLLNSFRIKAWDRFLQLGMPKRKRSYFPSRFLDLYQTEFSLALAKKIEKKDIQSYIYPESKHSYITFINGHFLLSLSDVSVYEGVELESLNQAMKSYGIFLQSRINKSIEEEKDIFAILNTAIYSKGAFFYLPPNTTLSAPLQVLHVIDESYAFYSPRLQLFLSENSHVQVTNTYISKKKHSFFYNYQMDVSLDRASSLQVCSFFAHSSNGWFFEGLRGQLKEKSSLDLFSFSEAPSLRQDYQVQLLEPEAKTKIKGIAFLQGNDFCKTDVTIFHKAENCLSDQLFKSVLKEKGQFYFNGKIHVDKIAQKTEAYQLNKNLILSDQAVLQSQPNLEILADDVKASHGMTATELNAEQLFYLVSRGISPQKAKELLVEGFCKKLIDECVIDSIKNKILSVIR